jgi:hypothetical protein
MRFWTLALMWGCAEVEQSASCEEYVECIRSRDAVSGVETDLARFEEDGACWGNPEGAGLCDRACTNGLEWMRDEVADLPEECGP